MKPAPQHRMKHRARHRASRTAPRGGTAALMIGGLVAGTVATAGATSMRPWVEEQAAPSTAELPADGSAAASGPDENRGESGPAPAAPQITSLRSASLDELRDQPAAARSAARSAPDGGASVDTLLTDSTFTGTTLEVAEPSASAGDVDPSGPTEEGPVPEREEHVHAETQQASAERAEPQQQAAAQEPASASAQQPAPPAPAVGGSLLDIAASYVGYPYVLYGTPPAAFDCSAYTWWVFKQAGIDIPRTVAGQKAAVTPVSDPRPGDLVIYNDWYHIGIYAGNGMTYEALNPSTDVRYGPLLSNNVWYGRIG